MKLDLKINFRFNLAGIRKYTLLLVPAGIVVVSVIVFVLVIMSGRSLAKQIQANSVSLGRRLDSMISDAPSSHQWEQAKQAMDRMADEVGKIEQLAKQDTQRTLLSYKIFPQPKDTSHQIYTEFGDQFRRSFDSLIQGIKALDAPIEAEMSKELGPEAVRSVRGNPAQGSDQSSKRIIDAFCIKRAQELSVYANPKLFPWYGFWEKYSFEGQEQAIRDCWYTQVAFWIYDDVFSTVGRLNEGSSIVFSSPVKRIVGVRFASTVDLKKSVSGYGGSYDGGVLEAFRDEPVYVQNPTSGMGTSERQYTTQIDFMMTPQITPWTSRTCSPEIDVLHFYIGVVVDAGAVSSFMQELCSEKTHLFRTGFLANGKEVEYKHNSITILGSQIEPVERTEPEHAYYRYGPSAVVFLKLECEYIFHRAGYEMIQPDSIKKILGITPTNPAGGTAPSPTTPPATPPMDRRLR